MTRGRAATSDDRIMPLEDGWRMAISAPHAVDVPAGLGSLTDWIAAPVPGTAAAALAAAGHYSPDAAMPLHDKDIWYVRAVGEAVPGAHVLRLEGLATIAQVFWNGEEILASQSMFLAHEVAVEAGAANELAICFRALAPYLERKGPRARWRPRLATSQGLRLVRTTLLGHMPGWCPEVHAVGPWRPVSLVKRGSLGFSLERLSATVDEDGTGVLSLALSMEFDGVPMVHCAGKSAPAMRQDNGGWRAEIAIDNVALWWPRTHGEPVLHDVWIQAGTVRIDVARTGFRRIEVDRGRDGTGFALKVNGVEVFCRGAVWTTPDIVALPGDSARYRPWLELAVEAGVNMLRIAGTMVYESDEFFALCDELGLLVWQDFQFANYDYPVADEAFVASVREEARQFLDRTQANPALAVLCGGSEIYQQGAMLGLPESRWKGPLCERVLPQVVAERRPDVPYVANSPCEGAMPFSSNAGVAHYYGVGAYLRPLEDARRAEIRFAGECLAFSNVPQQATLDAHLPAKPGHDPRWRTRVPRDRGAGWDFEDVRDHYFKLLHEEDPVQVRYGDPARYLDLSRAVSGEVMEAVFADWRRAAAPCAGALVWTWQDLVPGAGWGVIDATGEPKPAWYGLKRAFRPVQVTMSDEGTNGLCVHVVNETAVPRDLVLTIACLRDGTTPVASGYRELNLAPREAREIAATDLFGAFFDTTYAFRFGPPAHDVSVARLADPATGEIVADAYHFPQGYPKTRGKLSGSVAVEQDAAGGWRLRLAVDRFAQSVHIADDTFRCGDDWFHLAPGAEKIIRLVRRTGGNRTAVPRGRITALNATNAVSFSA